MKFIVQPEVVAIKDGSFTERGERVYTSMTISVRPPDSKHVVKTIQCETGIGFTEEWIEETVQGCALALKKDFPHYRFKVLRIKPNNISFEYEGSERPN